MDFKITNENIPNLSPRYTTTYAIKKGYFNLVRCLLRLGADPNYVSDREILRRNSLIYNTFVKDDRWAENIAHNLLEQGADLSRADAKGLNPIHYCCAFGRHNLLEIFLNSVDFDLSRSLDKNGNNCMHYAIRSHNLKCVDLIIKKFKTSEFSKSINIANKFGMRPVDIEDGQDEEFSLIKTSLFNGTNTLDECKMILRDYLRYCNQVKMAKIQAEIQSKMAAIEQKSPKKKKSKKSKKSNSNSTENLENKDLTTSFISSQIFKTQLDELEFTAPLSTSTEIIKKTIPKILTNSNFNHYTGKIKIRQAKSNVPQIVIHPPVDTTKQLIVNSISDFRNASTDSFTSMSKIMSEMKFLPQRIESPEAFIDQQTAINLTLKSFLLIYKDFLMNLIEYDDLFYAKEHMVQSGLVNKISRVQFEVKPNKEERKPQPTWKESMPDLFKTFENEMTASFRHSIHPPVLKKVKSNQKYYQELKTQSKQVALSRKKKSKIVIVRNSLFNRLSTSNEFMISPETFIEEASTVFDDEICIQPLNGRSSSSTVSRRKE